MKKFAFLALLLSICQLQAESFSYNLSKVAFTGTNNVFLSPYSIKMALDMAKAGADGKTYEELETVIGAESLPQFSDSKSSTFSSAQALAIDNKIHYSFSYMNTVQSKFKSQILPFDFRTQKEYAITAINSWAATVTHDLIKNLITTQDIDEATKLLLLNAVYFKSEWLKKFDANYTSKAPFWNLDGSSSNVDMMCQTAYFKTMSNADCSVLELDFKQEPTEPQYSCLFVLPSSPDKLKTLEEAVSDEQVQSWKQALASDNVELYLPKLDIDYRVELKPLLEKMGIKEAFSEKANFSKIAKDVDLFISKVIHQSALKMDESGLEAAAATAVIMNMTMSLEPPIKRILRFDRPFLMILQEKGSGTALFTGRISAL